MLKKYHQYNERNIDKCDECKKIYELHGSTDAQIDEPHYLDHPKEITEDRPEYKTEDQPEEVFKFFKNKIVDFEILSDKELELINSLSKENLLEIIYIYNLHATFITTLFDD